MIHLVTYGDRHGYIRVLRFADPARAYTALQLQCSRGELTQVELLWAMRQLAEVCRGIYAVEQISSGGPQGCETRPEIKGSSATSGVLGRCAVRLPAAGLLSWFWRWLIGDKDSSGL